LPLAPGRAYGTGELNAEDGMNQQQIASRGHDATERRGAFRVNVVVSVWATAGGVAVDRSACDIGIGGLFVVMDAPPPVGTFLQVAVSLDDSGEPLLARGMVRWRREAGSDRHAPPGVGVKFLDLSQGQEERIWEFVRRRSDWS